MLNLEHRYWQVGLLQKLLFFLLLSLLVLGENKQHEESSVVNVGLHADKESPKSTNRKLKIRSFKLSFDALFSSKRKVPNAADPLHNR